MGVEQAVEVRRATSLTADHEQVLGHEETFSIT
jgi:hypothetical protein